MRKLLTLLLAVLLLLCTGCAKEEVDEGPQPVAYSDSFSIMVKNDSGIETIEDLKDKKIGIQKYLDQEYMEYVKEQLSSLELSEDSYVELGSYQQIVDAVANGEIDAFVLPEKHDEVIHDFRSDYVIEDYKAVVEYQIPYYEEQVIDSAITSSDLWNKPFLVMINGIDGAGDNDQTNLRNDVNHLMVVDPVKKHVLIISFPRDSYMYNVTYQYSDKMTHMHVYGGEETIIASVGELLDVEIPYYCVTSFSNFVNMINEFGGVWIDVPMHVYMDMDSNRNVAQPYEMEKGYKKCYGEWALALARNRKYNGIVNNDFSRIRNQALIINSIIARVAKYPFILDMMGMSWLCNYLTDNNFTEEEITVLLELAKTFEDGYTIDNYFIDGEGGHVGEAYVSFMKDESIEIVKGKIQLVLTGEADKESPYYEDIMTGYITGGAGTVNDGDENGYIGTEFDLNEVYPQ